MKFAVTYGTDGNVFQHFGRCESFKIFEAEDGKIVNSEVLGTNGVGHHDLAGWLKEHDVETVICGGLGGGMVNALNMAGISIAAGVTGPADAAAEAFLNGQIVLTSEGNCDCHDGEHHHHEGEDCHCHEDDTHGMISIKMMS